MVPLTSRRLLVAAVLVAVLGALAPVASVSAQTDAAASATGCPPSVPRQVALVLGRLDPDAGRVVHGLARALAGPGEVDVLVAVARPEPLVVLPWQRVDAERLDPLTDAIGLAADPGDGPPSATSLTGTIPVVAAELADLASSGPVEPCRVVVGLGSELDLSDGALCDAVAAELDPLGAQVWFGATEVSPGEVEPVAEGRWSCGDGVVVEASDAATLAHELIRVLAAARGAGLAERPLTPCTDAPCAEGRWELVLDPVLGRISSLVTLPSGESELVLGFPWSVELPLQVGVDGRIAAGNVTIVTTWLDATTVHLDAVLDPSRAEWAGAWSLTVVDPDLDREASVLVAAEPGLVPTFVAPPRLVEGRAATVTVELTDLTGRYVPADDLAGLAAVVVEVLDADGAVVADPTLAPDGHGGFEGVVELPADLPAGTLEAVARLRTSTNLVALADTSARAQAERLGPDDWPRLATTSVVLRGDRGGTASGDLVVVAGPAVDACVWLEGTSVTLGGREAAASLGDARSVASCLLVPAGETAQLPLAVALADDLLVGRHQTTALVGVGTPDDPSHDVVAVALTVEVREPVDLVRRLAITAALSLAALGLPIAAVWCFDVARARFRPSRRAVVAEVGVVVWPDGSIRRADNGTALLVGNDMFESAVLRRGRRLGVAGLTFSVFDPRSPLRPPVGTVSSPVGAVVARDGLVVVEGRVVGRVPLRLRDTWVFELSAERTRRAALDPAAPDFQAVYGRLVLLRASLEADAIDLTRLPRLARQLARTALGPTEGDAATAQEMLEFVEANVLAPRDLPVATRPALGPGAVAREPTAPTFDLDATGEEWDDLFEPEPADDDRDDDQSLD